LAVKKLADSFGYGMDHSPFLGAGIEFVQSRPYQWGDSVRSIDWRVTARTGKVFVKEYEAPKRLPCYLMLDTSASMTISSQPRSKYATALHVAGGLAFACLNRVSPVGLVGLGSSELYYEPSLSADRVWQWLHRLRRFRYDETTSVGRRIAQTSPTMTSRAIVVVLSDLHDPQALPAIKLLAQRHDCAVLQFIDPAEHGVRGSGFMRAREAETGRSVVALGRKAWLDPSVVANQLKQAGIDHLAIQTDKPFIENVRQFFKARDLVGKGTR
jgi:uncharacterized protein (DUF58 family)